MPITLKKSSLKYKDHEGNMQDIGLPVGGVITDTTLTKSGTPADAKVTGEKISQLQEEIADMTGGTYSPIEPMDDDIPKVYFTGTLPTSKNDGDVPVSIHYKSRTEDFIYPATLKVQGGSSVNYPKKNFTLKMYEDEALENKVKYAFKDWGKLNKFVLKAHWIDHSHVRNVGTAKIWGKIVASRSDYNSLPEELRNAPNNGATDGFTVKVFANGVYQGLYEWIVPKDKLFGQDSDIATHSIMNSELNNQPTCAFSTTTPTISGNWSEELQDTMSSNISTSFENLIKFVAGSTDEEFVANAENYFDVQSVIDFDIFARVFCIIDNLCRNQIFFTYDGVKWYEGVWDVDAVLGLPPTTRGFFAYNTEFQTGYVAYKDYGVINLLYQRVETLFIDRFKERYSELRSSVLSIENILDVYERLTDVVKTYDGLLEEDFSSTTGNGKFTGIPYTSENNIQQIRSFIAQRIPYMDEVIATFDGSNSGGGEITPTNIMDGVSWTYGSINGNTGEEIVSTVDIISSAFDISKYVGETITVEITGTTSYNAQKIIYFDSNDSFISCTYTSASQSTFTSTVPTNAVTAKAGMNAEATSYKIMLNETVIGESSVENTGNSVTSISASYTGGAVFVGTDLTDLTGIVVTATYSDGTTATVTDYTLSGTIAEGENTITVNYDGLTTTFIVTGYIDVTGKPNLLESLVFNKGFINYETGVFTSQQTTHTISSESYIPVVGGKRYMVNVDGAVVSKGSEPRVGIKYYKADNSYTGQYVDDADKYVPYTFTVPNNIDASYVRLSFTVYQNYDGSADWSNATYTMYEV